MSEKSASSRQRTTLIMPEKGASRSPRVFPAAPSVKCYFASESAERARSALVRCVERMDGPALLIGPSGSGKSLLLAVLADLFRYRLSVAVLTGGALRTPRELHQGILYALGMHFRGMDEGELRLTLLARLEEEDEDSQEGVLLLVDEAQSLPVDLMEEIRMLTNVVRDGVSRVRLVLAGAPELEEQLADARLASLQQRLAVRCYLTHLSRRETREYILAHLSAAQLDASLFTSDAIDQVYDVTEGLPRLVNQLCDHVLLLAGADARASVDARLVDEAWSDLQQFPAARTAFALETDESYSDAQPEANPRERSDNVLEFGALGDDEEPAARLDTIEERLSSISIESARRSARGDRRADGDEIDFSLPEGDRPEVEIVFRGSSAGGHPATGSAACPIADDFREEEVVADPFQTEATAGAPTWAPTRQAAVTELNPAFGERAAIGVAEARVAADRGDERDVPPLQSVPLMAHVETNLFAPDPVWPDEQFSTASIVLSGQEQANALSGPVGAWDRASAEQAVGSAQEPAAPDRATAPVKRNSRAPAPKRFATLFSSLQD